MSKEKKQWEDDKKAVRGMKKVPDMELMSAKHDTVHGFIRRLRLKNKNTYKVQKLSDGFYSVMLLEIYKHPTANI